MANPSLLRAVVFQVGDLVCALPAGIVLEVLSSLTPTRIPGTDESVAGLVNVRGALLTVVDAHALLGRAALADDEGAIIVVDRGARRVGLLVGRVLDFLEVPAHALASTDMLPGVDARIVQAVGSWADRHFVVLDTDKLLASTFGADGTTG